jgi:adenosylhomocysteine nucleosidase
MGLCSTLRRAALALLVATASWPGWAAPPGVLDDTPRIAVVCAFEQELTLLLSQVQQPHREMANGVEFTTGILQGKPVVLFESGVSMVNAAMTMQLALDRFRVTHIVVSGIAGGVNPRLAIGDVTVPARWGQYLETYMARETAPGQFATPGFRGLQLPNFGMMFPRPVTVRSAQNPDGEQQFWFSVDHDMFEAAKRLEGLQLAECDAKKHCLSAQPHVVLGGNGVSGQAFVDNAAFRAYTYSTFEANVLDMETAAIGTVAHANGVPWIAFRSLSDLAGGGKGENEINTYMRLAADNSARVLLAFLADWK